MSSSKQDFTLYSSLASKWAACALLDLLPEALLEKDSCQGPAFYYQFRVSKPIDQKFLEQLEERMILLRNQDLEVRMMEMVPRSAKELFLHHKQRLLAEEMAQSQLQTVFVSQIGERYDLIRSKFDPDLEKMRFKITHFQQSWEQKSCRVQIFGLAASSANDLKKCLKKHREIEKYHHERLGVDQNLFLCGLKGWIVLPKGIDTIQSIKGEIWQKFKDFGFSQIQVLNSNVPLKENFETARSFLSCAKLFSYQEGLSRENEHFKNNLDTSDSWAALVDLKEIEKECISYLKFYLQIIKILGFSYELKYYPGTCPKLQRCVEAALKKSELEYQLEKSGSFKIVFELIDRYDRKCLAPFWTLEKEDGQCYLRGSFCSSYEKLLGWLLEDRQGELPKKWNSHLLKILSLKEGGEFGKRLYDYFTQNNIKASLDESKDKLNVRLKKAYLEKVPYIAIIGAKEQEEEKLTVKVQKLNKECVFTKEELLEHLLKEENER